MNIGLTVFIPPKLTIEGYEMGHAHGAGKMFKMIFFSTFVIVLEIISFCLALGMGMSLAVAVAAVSAASPTAIEGSSLFIAELLSLRLQTYMLFCVPILAISAYMEASVIKGA